MEERWRKSFLLKRTQGEEDSRKRTFLFVHYMRACGKNMQSEASFVQTTATRIFLSTCSQANRKRRSDSMR